MRKKSLKGNKKVNLKKKRNLLAATIFAVTVLLANPMLINGTSAQVEIGQSVERTIEEGTNEDSSPNEGSSQTFTYSFSNTLSGILGRQPDNNQPEFLIGRRSFYFITGNYIWENGRRHANGVVFHLWNILDGEKHWANMTGLWEMEFMDGEYYRDDDWHFTTAWSGPGPNIWGNAIPLRWPNRPIKYIHLRLDYTEDDQFIRTIERTFWGNWDDQQDGAQKPRAAETID